MSNKLILITFLAWVLAGVITYTVMGVLIELKSDLTKISIYETQTEKYVKITVYNPKASQTSGNPLETATGEVMHIDSLNQSIAISRDLEKYFKMNDKVMLICDCPFNGYQFRINDRTAESKNSQIDIFTHQSSGLYYGKIIKL